MLQGNLKTNFLFAVQSHVDSQSSIIVIGFLKGTKHQKVTVCFWSSTIQILHEKFSGKRPIKTTKSYMKSF